MNAITPFAFEDQLVRVIDIDGESWFVGKDVCQVLDIQKHHQALDRLDDDERGTCTVGTPSGDQEMIVISEPGVYRLVFASRKPEAERFKRWLAHEVLPALRRTGRFEIPEVVEPEEEDETDFGPSVVMNQKIRLVSLAHKLSGPKSAKVLWQRLGLPDLPAAEAMTDMDRVLEFIKEQGTVRQSALYQRFKGRYTLPRLNDILTYLVDDGSILKSEGPKPRAGFRATVYKAAI